MKKILIMLFCVVAMLISCAESGRTDTEYLGTWRLQTRKPLHTILSLRNNGTFEVDLRVEGQMTKIVEKRGSASGRWHTNQADGSFTMAVTEGNPEIGWQTGARNFTISEMDGQVLVLASPDGKTYRWEKLGLQESENSTGTELTSISLAPVIVNLSPSSIKAHQRYKWLCTAIDIFLEPVDESPKISPQLKDKILLFLSSMTYGDVDTQDELKTLSKQLRDLINPYMVGRVEKVTFDRTIVTGNQEAVDNFRAEYEKS